jgi:hypothetical protein
MRPRHRNTAVVLAVSFTVSVGLGACGSSAGSSTPSTGTSRTRSGLISRVRHYEAVRACLAKQGISLAALGSERGAHVPTRMTGIQFERALESCGESVADIVGSRASRGIVP